MINYYKIIDNGIITGFGTNGNDNCSRITKTEYNGLLSFINTRPEAPDGFQYVIRDDPREWMLVPVDPDPEIDDAEALDIILGGGEA